MASAAGCPEQGDRRHQGHATRLVSDPAYVAALEVRLRRGTAGAVEIELFRHAYGQPKQDENVNVRHSGTVGFRWMYRHESDDADPE